MIGEGDCHLPARFHYGISKHYIVTLYCCKTYLSLAYAIMSLQISLLPNDDLIYYNQFL